jgi:hypothetical protein
MGQEYSCPVLRWRCMDTEKQIHEIAVLCGKSGGIADAQKDLIYIRATVVLFYDNLEGKTKRVRILRRVTLYNRIVFAVIASLCVLGIFYDFPSLFVAGILSAFAMGGNALAEYLE